MVMKLGRGPSSDLQDSVWTLKNVHPAKHHVKQVDVSNGYVAESNHDYARDIQGARTATPIRTNVQSYLVFVDRFPSHRHLER
jgi:hypothetical protein